MPLNPEEMARKAWLSYFTYNSFSAEKSGCL
ncbi:hypothetical protein ROJ8625_03717 [Roseivivax jejudonensis]|uniref:Uncharacterized protein n=1 Tax=Roseivivax jejudonensis TaxID=1529041 RepID=A0A1X7A5R5_9RHOB|nr:hypothetical protein ROJ8625_03717 [Roseivivax jejudonensis]